ncbi:Papain-like cysteine peptidase [Gracilaria domingensis]|nr:Papain-like cysteine peptidase [Gracilaria domingensis]
MDLFAFRLRNRNVERVRKHSVGEKVVVLDSLFVSRLRHARDNHKRNEVFDDLHRWFQKTSWTFEEAEKILCPYLSGRHWFLLAVNVQDDMVTMYDSFSRNTETASEAAELLKQFSNFVAQKRSGKEKDWVTLEKAAYPKQTDRGSCAIFVAFVMKYLERGAVPLFEQRNIPLLRSKAKLFIRGRPAAPIEHFYTPRKAKVKTEKDALLRKPEDTPGRTGCERKRNEETKEAQVTNSSLEASSVSEREPKKIKNKRNLIHFRSPSKRLKRPPRRFQNS